MSTPQPEREQADVEMTDRDDDFIDWSIKDVEVVAAEGFMSALIFKDASVHSNRELQATIKAKLVEVLRSVFVDNAALNALCQYLNYVNYLIMYGKTRSQLIEAMKSLVPLKKQETINEDRIDMQALKNSFGIAFNDNDALVDSFISNFMVEFGKQWRRGSNKVLSPYCSLVQSSGCGKSRFLREVGKKAFVFFVCLRDSKSVVSTYPPRSACADYLLPPETKEIEKTYYLNFFLACLAYLEQHLKENEFEYKEALEPRRNINPEEPGPSSSGDSKIWSKFIDRQFETPSSINQSTVMGGAFWDKVGEHLKKAQASQDSKQIIDGFALLCKYKVPVLFAFDEARALLRHAKSANSSGDQVENLFRIVRRDLALFANSEGQPIVTAIFTDTNSKVANFSGPDRLDPSYRIGASFKLKEPKWLLPGWSSAPRDLWETHKESYAHFFRPAASGAVKPVEDSMDTDSLDSPATTPIEFANTEAPQSSATNAAVAVDQLLRYYYSIGRPLWYSFIQGYEKRLAAVGRPLKAYEYEDIVSTARMKLASNDLKKKVTDARSILAVLNCRLCFSISGSSIVASQLVSDGMALNVYTGNNREFLTIGYPFEPMLVNASVYWMNNARISYLDQVKVLVDSLMEGQVLYGYKGELMSRLLLTWAFDCAVQKHITTEKEELFIDLYAVTVRQFLLSLYGEDAIKALEVSCHMTDVTDARKKNLDSLLNGYVRIGKWIKLDAAPKNDKASYYFSLGAALMTTEQQPGCDKLIPVYLKDRNAFTWIHIEDKNCKKTKNGLQHAMQTSFKSVFDEDPENPYLMLFIQLDSEHQPGVETLFGGTKSNEGTMATRNNKPGKEPKKEHLYKFALGSYKVTTSVFKFLQEKAGDGIVENLELLRKEKFKSEYKDPAFIKEYEKVSASWPLEGESFVPFQFKKPDEKKTELTNKNQ
ncbi:hypothetical protein MP638_004387 [Amoeboaphelidium occidentale]|nr:hypothetical protein MP638_004387 [Amoeboaphelidium occidentale]